MGKSFPGRGTARHKGPEAEACLEHLWGSSETSKLERRVRERAGNQIMQGLDVVVRIWASLCVCVGGDILEQRRDKKRGGKRITRGGLVLET